MMSEGSRSTVNWMRAKWRSIVLDRTATSSVLARPGTPCKQQVAAGEQRDQEPLDDHVLADHHGPHALPHRADELERLAWESGPSRRAGRRMFDDAHDARSHKKCSHVKQLPGSRPTRREVVQSISSEPDDASPFHDFRIASEADPNGAVHRPRQPRFSSTPAQKASAVMTSPPARVIKALKTITLIEFLMNRTEPSANPQLNPPGCGEPAPKSEGCGLRVERQVVGLGPGNGLLGLDHRDRVRGAIGDARRCRCPCRSRTSPPGPRSRDKSS